MTIASPTNRATFTGNGVTTSFSFPYYVIAAADLKVYQAGVLKTLTTHYTLSGSAPYVSGTNVQFVAAPASGDSIVVIRDPAITQSVDVVENDPLPVESSLEQPLDKLTMIAQRLKDRLDRGALLGDTYTGSANPTLPPPGAGRYLRWNAAGTALEAVEGEINTSTFTGSGDGTVPRSIPSKLGEIKSVEDYGASVGNTAAENTAAIQAALDDLDHGEALFFPNIYEVEPPAATGAALLIPTKSGVTYHGLGSQVSGVRLVNGTADNDVFARADTSAADSNNINYITFRGLTIEADGDSRHGINWLSMSRSSIYDVHFTALGGAALRVTSSLALTGQRLVVNSCDQAVLQDTGGWTGLNGIDLRGFYIQGCGNRAIDIRSGMSKFVIDGIVESCTGGGIELAQDCTDGVIHIYGEGNVLAATTTEDIYIGSTGVCSNIVVMPSYYNGDVTADDFHYPVRIRYAHNCTIMGGTLTTGSKFIKFEAGSLINNEIHPPKFIGGAFVPTNQSQATYAFAATVLQSFIAGENRIVDPTNAPFTPNNVVRKRLPYGWTLTVAGGSTIAKSDVDVGALYGVRMIRGTDACVALLSLSIPAEFKGNFCSFVVPVLSRVADKSLSASFGLNGTAPVNGENIVTSAVGQATLVQACGFVPSDATTIDLVIQLDSNSADYDVGHPALYVGAQPWYSANGTDPFWTHSAAPTTGTWADGDRVKNSAPASGGTPGWVCTTPGAAGVFVFSAEANLA